MNRVVGLLLAWCAVMSHEMASGVEPWVEPLNRFSIRLLNQLAEGTEQNLVLSPFSVYMALCMLSAGAAGDTEAELVGLLGLPEDRAQRPKTWQSLGARLTVLAQSGVTLESANRFWVQRSYELLSEFLRELQAGLGAVPAQADFVADPEAARRDINAWVEERTRQRIRDLIAPGILTRDTRLVLVNAVYFYGFWANRFSPDRTRPALFHELVEGRGGQVQMMEKEFQAHEITYAEGPGWQACEIPYQGGKLAMNVLLPQRGTRAWEALHRRLSDEGLSSIRRHLRPKRVRVFLPRFRIESSVRLDGALQALGLRSAFDPNLADLSRITGRRELFVSAALHKGFVEVQEKGTEAAAATAVVVTLTAAPMEPEEPVVFRADRPFVFVIVDRETGTSLFWGRVVRTPTPTP